MTDTTQTRCPECGNTETLQICFPTWFKFHDIQGELDGTTLVDVDVEADAWVLCGNCLEEMDAKGFYSGEDGYLVKAPVTDPV